MGESASGTSAFGAVLRRQRDAAGLTQEELAERSGLSVRAISDLERGRTRRPYRGSVQSLARALELAEADRDEFVRAARGRVPATQPDRPRQLPAALPDFAGRTVETAALDRLLDGTAKAVTISAIGGMAGVGKTALAVHWAHRVADRFPDGQLYVNLRGFDPSGSPMPPEQAIRGFLGALGMPAERIPSDLDAAASLYRTVLTGKRLLVLLDNARDTAQVRALLPGSPGCLVLVTSRSALGGLVADGAQLLPLDLPTEEEAREVLARRLGWERIASEPEAGHELIGACDRLPLALAVVAARAAMRPEFSLASLAVQLRDIRSRLSALDAGDPSASVPAAFSWSVSQLDAAPARMFRLLSVHPGPEVSVAAAAGLAGTSRADAQALLGQLCGAHLLTEHGPGRFALHDLLHAYANELAESDPERDEATRRMLDHYLHTACAADRLANQYWRPIAVEPAVPGVQPEELGDRAAAIGWLTTEEQVLPACVQLAAERGLDTQAVGLAGAIRYFLHLRGYWPTLLSGQLIAVAAAERIGDRDGLASAHRGAGMAYTRLDRPEPALRHLRAARDAFRGLGDLVGTALAVTGISSQFQRLGDYRAAAEEAHEALELFQQSGDRVGQARALNNIGWNHGLLGEHEKELHYCVQALALNREIGDTLGEAYAVDSVGHAHFHLGHLPEALACYRRALELNHEAGDYVLLAEALDHLGDAHRALGDAAAARTAWAEAVEVLRDVDPAHAERVRAKQDAMVAR